MDGVAPPVEFTTAHDGSRLRGNRRHYHIQWLERPGSGAWVEACSEWGLAGMICWCPGGALLAHVARYYAAMLLTEGVSCP